MKYRIGSAGATGKTIYLRVDKGERVIETVRALCEELGVLGGTFSGIGACCAVDVRTWIPERADYVGHEYEGMIEMVSLSGNVTRDREGRVRTHAHGVFSRLDAQGRPEVLAGHLADATIGYTGEIAIVPAAEPIDIEFDEAAGIDVWSL